jgi:outer membrane protein assembly factor BamB
MRSFLASCCVLLFFAAPSIAAATPASQNWPSFRGPSASGVSDDAPAATTWDVPAGKNVKWKTAIPGLGLSSPVIWSDRLYVTTAVKEGEGQKLKVGLYGDIKPVEENDTMLWKVFCLDRNTGKVLWEQTANRGVPKIKRHPKSSHANPTVATDGKHVVASFGSEGLYCYDPDGKLLWLKDLGVLDSGFYMVPDAQWGFASSPVIYDGKVIVQCDVQKDSFLAVYNVEDGKEVWRTPRKDLPTWSTPTVYRDEKAATQVVCNGFNEMAGYDFATGKRLWQLRKGGDIPVPTPIIDGENGFLFLTSAHGPNAPLFAVRPGARGEITLDDGKDANESVAWSRKRFGVYMQTPILYRGFLYGCRDNGVLTCLDPKTGKELYTKRLEGGVGFTASPVASDGKLYFTSEDGQVHVVKAGATFEDLATNPLGEVCMATPAVSDGVLFFRTQAHVIAIGGNEAGAAR